MNDNLVKKFLKFSYGSWIGLILGLATTMLTTRILTPDSLGKASMFELFLQVGMIITVFGTDQSFIRFFYEEKEDKRGALLYNTLKLPFITIILMLIVLFTFYRQITFFLIEKVDIYFAWWLAIGIVAQLIFRFAQLVIRMQQKGNIYSVLQIFQRVFNLCFILLFFHILGSKFEILIFSKVITLVLLMIIAVYFGKGSWKVSNLKKSNVKHSQKDIIHFGAPFVLTIFIYWLFESFDKIALRQWSDFNELGLYAAAMRLVALVMVLKQTFSTFWTPVAYEKFNNNPNDKDFFRSISIVVSFAMFLVAIASIAGKDIIVMLLGSEFETAAKIMPFLVFMPIFYTISETTVVGINFYKKTKWHILIASIACIANIIGNWLLVPSYGAIGASLSTAFSFIIFFTLRTQISRKYFKVAYPLGKIYLMVVMVSIYAVFSINSTKMILNILFSIIPITILIFVYLKDLIYVYRNRTNIIN